MHLYNKKILFFVYFKTFYYLRLIMRSCANYEKAYTRTERITNYL